MVFEELYPRPPRDSLPEACKGPVLPCPDLPNPDPEVHPIRSIIFLAFSFCDTVSLEDDGRRCARISYTGLNRIESSA